MRALFFWITAFAVAVALQRALPGVDVLAAGLILALQRESVGRILGIAAATVLVQEGAGSLAFGTGILVYGLLAGGFLVGRQLFAGQSLVFVALLCLWHGLCVLAATGLLAGLQDLALPQRPAGPYVLGQAALLFVVWALLRWLHPTPEGSAAHGV